MTHRDEEAKIVFIAEEFPSRCELCRKVAETRPYGPFGEEVCFECGMKNEEAAKKQFGKLFEEGT